MRRVDSAVFCCSNQAVVSAEFCKDGRPSYKCDRPVLAAASSYHRLIDLQQILVQRQGIRSLRATGAEIYASPDFSPSRSDSGFQSGGVK